MDGRRFAIKEALTGEPAVAAQGVTKDSRYLTAEQMLAELDKIFMPKQNLYWPRGNLWSTSSIQMNQS